MPAIALDSLLAYANVSGALTVRSALWQPSLDDAEIQAYLLDEVGPEGIEMAAFLRDHKHVSGEDVLAAFPLRKPSDVRKVLYRMMECHAAEYEKDTDSKGWETFYWDLDLPEMKHIMRRRWYDELRNIRRVLRDEESNQHYCCKDRHRRMLFDDALELDFACPVCKKPMAEHQSMKERDVMKKRLAELLPAFADTKDPNNPVM